MPVAWPETPPRFTLQLYGAGHVGRALVHALSPLPDVAITWVDTAPDRFPEILPGNTRALQVYEAAGFRRMGLRKAYYPAAHGQREDALVMACSLFED